MQSNIEINSGFNPLARIKFKEAMALLLIKDEKTMQKWCRKWVAPIYAGGWRFLLKEEFELAQRRQLAECNPEKFGANSNRPQSFQQINNHSQKQDSFRKGSHDKKKYIESLSLEARKFNEYITKKAS